ncbi:4914_t:CDS:2 [Paraglomus brasilianum]|uniref:4914_t:CDS:1 n=1 Tax=Paraglomus brasilianum TaxID=144538 RepID=A0A9N9A1J0_9GLOM|nr:4914_t:CDS:2 [Paraglomus brasilianum]
MSDFVGFLARDFGALLENADDYDMSISVGQGQNARVFNVHSLILRARSSYFRKTLVHSSSFEHISPSIFEVLLRYMYTGSISLDELEAPELLDLLITAEKLALDDMLLDHTQNQLIREKEAWLKSNYGVTNQIASQNQKFSKLQEFCQIIRMDPEILFESEEFYSLEEEIVLSLLKRDDLTLTEGQIWSRIIEWGIDQTQLSPDYTKWSPDEFAKLEKKLHNCIPLIRFFQISPRDFDVKVFPFESILPKHLFRELISHYLRPRYEPSYQVLPPRYGQMNPTSVHSVLINERTTAWIASQIDNNGGGTKDDGSDTHSLPYEGSRNPYRFRLLLRGSRDGFTPSVFHTLCDQKGATITLIKVNGTDELIGGYNPIDWRSPSIGEWDSTEGSFIFSLNADENKNVVSRVKHPTKAIFCGPRGPTFGGDILIADLGLWGNDFKQEKRCCCINDSYATPIRSTHVCFSVDEYEVFQVVRKAKHRRSRTFYPKS